MTIVIAILAFGLLIFIHELGHYLTARLFDVHVLEFSIGMGPKLISRTSKKTGIAYSLRLLPFGGFVAMAGEDDDGMVEVTEPAVEESATDAVDADRAPQPRKIADPRALCNKPVWQRIIITAAGGVMNLLLGLILSAVYVCSSSVIGAPVVAEFNENAVSQNYGLEPGDVITHVNGKAVGGYMEMSYIILHDGNEPIDLTIRRDVTFYRNDEGIITSWKGGEKVELNDVTFGTEEAEGIVIGMLDFKVVRVAKTPSNLINHTFSYLRLAVRQVWDGVTDLVTGRVGVEHVSGPVGVAEQLGNAVSLSFNTFIYLVLVITVNLGIFNLLPIPALDGGRIAFQLIELIFRKPVPREVEAKIHAVAIVALLLLMLVVTGKDIFMLFK